MIGAKVYISSSWKNRDRVRKLAIALREAGHLPYDFTDPRSRKTKEIPPEAFLTQFDPLKHDYEKYLRSVPQWRKAVEGNKKALDDSDVVVLLLPCGNDAHADWAYAVGRGKVTAVVGCPRPGDRTPTHMWADAFLFCDDCVIDWIASL